MGCDAYADEDGKLIIKIGDYGGCFGEDYCIDQKEFERTIEIDDLAPKQRLYVDYIKGRPR